MDHLTVQHFVSSSITPHLIKIAGSGIVPISHAMTLVAVVDVYKGALRPIFYLAAYLVARENRAKLQD